MNLWKYIYFFEKNGKYYNFDYDQTNDIWTGDIYLPQVSTGLFEVGQLFILQESLKVLKPPTQQPNKNIRCNFNKVGGIGSVNCF